jgi:nitrogen regulatory protein PII 2
MKEVMCFIRPKKIGDTKRALAENGFPAFTCSKCTGRGKSTIDPELLSTVLEAGELPLNVVGENLTEATRLIARRFFTFIVEDSQVEKAVQTVIAANQTGNPGDGKIFILPILEAYTVSDGQPTIEAF